MALWSFLVLAPVSFTMALPLTESEFIEIVNDVTVIQAQNKTTTPAKKNTWFKSPDLVRTGQESRVELSAKDQTVTRVGSNTTFTFAQDRREIEIEAGSVLFHSPKGAGGGAVKNRGTSAAVLGTTMLCAVLPDGSFKVLVLEGEVSVQLRSGMIIKLKAGQFMVVPAEGDGHGDVTAFNISEFCNQLQLLRGFSRELSSLTLIEAAAWWQLQDSGAIASNVDASASLKLAFFGLDLYAGGPNDTPLFNFQARGLGNPLDLPGMGPIKSSNSEMLPDSWFNPLFLLPGLITPPVATDVYLPD